MLVYFMMEEPSVGFFLISPLGLYEVFESNCNTFAFCAFQGSWQSGLSKLLTYLGIYGILEPTCDVIELVQGLVEDVLAFLPCVDLILLLQVDEDEGAHDGVADNLKHGKGPLANKSTGSQPAALTIRPCQTNHIMSALVKFRLF